MLRAHSYPSNIYLVNRFSSTIQNQSLFKYSTYGFIANSLIRFWDDITEPIFDFSSSHVVDKIDK